MIDGGREGVDGSGGGAVVVSAAPGRKFVVQTNVRIEI